ncbi:MAG: NAD(P)/FAD-dependent oxidoreductase [Akkermansiaceae bacterium]
MEIEQVDIAVIGGGPAGLRAAEVASKGGAKVVLFDAKPSVGRKFLVAGKGGLNLTHGEDLSRFIQRYSGGGPWESMLQEFSPKDLVDWCNQMGLETFQASSGRIYPRALKGAPVLRAWLQRLKSVGVEFRMKHQWEGLEDGNTLSFSNGSGVQAKSIIFALGGASWPSTGSDGSWVEKFRKLGIQSEALISSNCGWEVKWSDEILAKAEGLPIKNIVVKAGETELAGELMVTKYGLEGGAIYACGSDLRRMHDPVLVIDFKPTFSVEELVAKLGDKRDEILKRAARAWKLSKPVEAILAGREWNSVQELAESAKAFRIELLRPRPIEEAISTAGGVLWSELESDLMLRQLPGVFVCGEMIDWDAPTGGYLLQAAFSTGTRAGQSAREYAAKHF